MARPRPAGRGRQPPRRQLDLSDVNWSGLGWVSLTSGLLLLLTAFLAAALAPLIWLGAGACLVFATVFLLLRYATNQLRAASPRRHANNWRQNAALLTALVTALSGLATSAVAFVRAGSGESPPPSAGTPRNCPETRWSESPGEKS